MAAKTYRITGALDGNFGGLAEADQTAASGDGWKVAKTTSGNSAEYQAGQAANISFTSQTTTPKPASFVTGSPANALKIPTALTGVFSSGSWVFTFAVRAGVASSQAGRMRMRVFKSANANGSGATELTGSTQVGTTSAALSTSADVTTVVTWSPGTTITLNNEYLFFVIAWEITTASGSNTANVLIRTGQSAAGSRLVTPSFAATDVIAPDTGISATSTVSGAVNIPTKPVVPAAISATSTVSGAITGPPFLTATYESGTAGNSLSTADAGSTSAFDTVNVAAGNTLTYDTVPLTTAGSLAAKHVVGTGVNCYWRWTTSFGTQTQFYARGYFKINQTSTSVLQWDLIWGKNPASTINTYEIRAVGNNTGKNIRVMANGAIIQTGTASITEGTIFRIEVFVDHTNGRLIYKLFIGANSEGTTPDETWDSGAGVMSFGDTATGELHVGPANSISACTIYSDGIAASLNGWIGPTQAAGSTKGITPAAISATSTVVGAIRRLRPIVPAAISATSSVSGGVAAVHKVSGTISATSSVSGAVLRVKFISGAISATSTVSGAVRATHRISGAISATSTVSGSFIAARPITPAAISATSSVSGSIRATHKISGAITAISTVSGIVGRVRPLVPTAISATSTVSGAVGRVRGIIPAAISASSTVVGAVVRLARVTGAISATSTVSGAVRATHRVSGAISATSVVSGSLGRLRPLVPATISATSTVTGAIGRIRRIVPAGISATSTVAGVVVARHKISGAISATSVVSGLIRIGGKISGATISAFATVSGAVRTLRRITPTSIAATSTVAGRVVALHRVGGAISATSTVSGAVVRLRPVSGAILAASSVSGAVTTLRTITGAINAASVVSGSIGRIVYPSGAISATATVSGTITFLRPVVPAAVDATSTVSGEIHAVAPTAIEGSITATSTVSLALRIGVTVYGKETPRLISSRYETPDLSSASYDEPVLERA